jgi:GTP-binding protein
VEAEGRRGQSPPVVAVVGRANVGKSSLVNRILGRRHAIVDATPGVTRDRHSVVAEWSGRCFELIDTGGLEPGPAGLEARVAEQAHLAMEAADVIVVVVDTSAGLTEDDHAVAEILRRSGKPILVAANKADDPGDEAEAAAFYRLGLGDPVPVSALHGRGSGDFLEALLAKLPARHPSEPDETWASLAIVGRPNVGKSSILNRLLGANRSIVTPSPGTTRDPVDATLALEGGRRLRLVDTAGMRREVKVEDPIEYWSLLRARRTLERVDAALLVMDAAEGVTGVDQRLAQEITARGRACLVALNKWDAVPDDDQERRRLERSVAERLRWLAWTTQLRTSATTGQGLHRVLPAVTDAVLSHRTRITTPEVNRIVRAAQAQRPHHRAGGRGRRILYAVQADVGPPTFVLFATGHLEQNYLRFLEGRIRQEHGFTGTPIRLQVRLRRRSRN